MHHKRHLHHSVDHLLDHLLHRHLHKLLHYLLHRHLYPGLDALLYFHRHYLLDHHFHRYLHQLFDRNLNLYNVRDHLLLNHWHLHDPIHLHDLLLHYWHLQDPIYLHNLLHLHLHQSLHRPFHYSLCHPLNRHNLSLHLNNLLHHPLHRHFHNLLLHVPRLLRSLQQFVGRGRKHRVRHPLQGAQLLQQPPLHRLQLPCQDASPLPRVAQALLRELQLLLQLPLCVQRIEALRTQLPQLPVAGAHLLLGRPQLQFLTLICQAGLVHSPNWGLGIRVRIWQ
mmetsp:Transcript_28832/g.49108  ORF Transcript_28832/g.49108 Transcript_28832/m.49108 type:complete len:280 (-) Transcript_28832:891-1730(-)